MPRNNDYTTGNLLYYLYHKQYYKLIGIDLSRQTNTTIPHQINFTRKLEKDDGGTMLFIAAKQQKTILKFSLDSLNVMQYINNETLKKMLNLLSESSESNFLTRNWNIVNNQSNASYDLGNETIFNAEVLKSNLCDYNDAYTS